MAKKAAAQKAEELQPVKGAAKSNGNSKAKLKNSAPGGLEKSRARAAASANGGSKARAGAGKSAHGAAQAPVEKKCTGNKSAKSAAKQAGEHKAQDETSQNPEKSTLQQPDTIMEMKRKLHQEIFEKCFEKKIFQDQDLDFWDQ